MMIELEKYQSGQELDDVVRLLEINDFEYEIENIIPDFDPSFSGKRPLELFSLKVKRSDISQINELLTSEDAKFDYNQIPSDYYLIQFTNEELLDVLLKPDEWSREDYRLSQLILEKRGKVITEDMLQKMKDKRLEDLRQPEKFDIDFTWWLNILLGSVSVGLWSIYLSWGHLTFEKDAA